MQDYFLFFFTLISGAMYGIQDVVHPGPALDNYAKPSALFHVCAGMRVCEHT